MILLCLAPAVLWLTPALARGEVGEPAGGPAGSGSVVERGGPQEEPPPRKRTLRRDGARRDWNPLSRPARAAQDGLRKAGIRLDFDGAFYDQQASEVATGKDNLGTFAWLSVVDWKFLQRDRLGSSSLGVTLLGSSGLNYDTADQSMSGNVGSASGLNANVEADPAALDELFLKQISPEKRWLLQAGCVDQSFYFDTNRVANNSYANFFSFALENNLSIPWPVYGGLGLFLRFEPRSDLYVMAGAGDSATDEPWAFWGSLDDRSWFELLEVGVTRHVPALGKGHYRLTPWHNKLAGADGWGVGFNFDQELGLDWLVAFFRFGIGQEKVTPVERFVSGGLGVERPFGRQGDWAGLGVAWSDPSPGYGLQSETLLELVYRLELSPSLALTPDLQLVFDPAGRLVKGPVVVGGLRFVLSL